jgi:hypothetical protein
VRHHSLHLNTMNEAHTVVLWKAVNCQYTFEGPIPVAASLRRGSTDVCLLGLRVRIAPVTWMSVSCGCCVLLVRYLCHGPIPRPEGSYRLWYVWGWSWSLINEDALAQHGLLPHGKKSFFVDKIKWKNIFYNKVRNANLEIKNWLIKFVFPLIILHKIVPYSWN